MSAAWGQYFATTGAPALTVFDSGHFAHSIISIVGVETRHGSRETGPIIWSDHL